MGNRLLKRRPKLFAVPVNADVWRDDLADQEERLCEEPRTTLRTRTTPTAAGGTSSTSLVAACVELERISREDAVGQPGNAKVVPTCSRSTSG